jgi:hypothetical protein
MGYWSGLSPKSSTMAIFGETSEFTALKQEFPFKSEGDVAHYPHKNHPWGGSNFNNLVTNKGYSDSI